MTRRLLLALAISALFPIDAAADIGTRSLKEIREEGVIIQQWDASCAAAALATVFTFAFSDPVSERDVASGMLNYTQPLRVRHRGGFSMLDMKRYVEGRGYKAVGLAGMSFDDVRYFQSPIVPITVKGYSHYVVIKGVDADGNVFLADPAFGNRSMSRARFEAVWNDGMVFAIRE
ncbi:C39 family peptidase [Ruegeria lacuscaerulensis]|uniref:C39 family peptidase n=1 Tax=Ruegeria lacuscaerulensis TaxID=55218 RepID=UPI00147BA52D|nr:cysteine peptidase family C39 domain-containing protein [Ruegeria lacuscaerulensis]